MGLIWANDWLWKGWAQRLYARHPERRPRAHCDVEALKTRKSAANNGAALPSPKAP